MGNIKLALDRYDWRNDWQITFAWAELALDEGMDKLEVIGFIIDNTINEGCDKNHKR